MDIFIRAYIDAPASAAGLDIIAKAKDSIYFLLSSHYIVAFPKSSWP